MSRVHLVEAARGDRPFDLAILNAKLVNVFTCEIYDADIGIWQDRIALVAPAGSETLDAKAIVDGSDKWAVPGFVDTHVHIESTMVTPAPFAEAVLPLGTTTVIIDPHEIGNVLGASGVEYMIAASEGLPLRVYVTVPSCVPAVPAIETAGASFGPEDVCEMLNWPRVIGVAEVMDYPGVVKCAPRMVGIVQAGLDANVTIQGHSPMLSGRDLQAYIAAGNESDHEIKGADEALEKLRLGMLPLLKDSSYGNPIPEIAPMLLEHPDAEVALCTDDIEPADLLEKGHMNRVARTMIAHGIDPARTIRFATLSGARHYGLRDHGAIAPGYVADILLLSSLEQVEVSHVFVGGELIAEKGKMVRPLARSSDNAPVENSVRIPQISQEDLTLQAPIENGWLRMQVMVLHPTRLTTRETVNVEVRQGVVDWRGLGEDVCLLSIIPRHGQGGKPSVVALRGFGLERGAMASTISHDSHNLAVAGRNTSDMLLAVKTLEELGGGVAVTLDGRVVASLALPVAGLMSTESVEALADKVDVLGEAVSSLGIWASRPALALAGMALPVAPSVRLTDMGLVDVATQELVPVFG